jgi:hypothetical protein
MAYGQYGNEYDDSNMFGANPEQPQPQATAGNPWSSQEEQAARQWAGQYIASHNIPQGYGTADDLVNSYFEQRRKGVAHDQAMSTVPGLLGWDKAPATTAGKGPVDNNWQAWFDGLFPGESLSPAQLLARESDITAAGGKVLRNAQGVAGKIQLPDGTIIDVIQGAGSGLNRKQWLTGGDSGSSASGMTGSLGDLTSPFTGQFTAPPVPDGPPGWLPPVPEFNPPNYTPPPAFAYEDFHAPSYEDAASDPGYQFAVKQGAQAMEQGAAAKGVLNTGGTLKDLLNYGQAAGATQYNNVFSRDLSSYGQNYKKAADTYATNAQTQYLQPYENSYRSAMDAFLPKMTQYATQVAAGQADQTNNYNRSWEQYLQSYNAFRDQRDSTWNKNFSYATA